MPGPKSLGVEHYRKRRREYMRAYRAAHPHVSTSAYRDMRKQRDTTLRRVYGITLAEYEAMRDEQGDACAVCRGRDAHCDLHVDHDHASGRVRGLLCYRCNMTVGMARDSADILRAAAAYLERSA